MRKVFSKLIVLAFVTGIFTICGCNFYVSNAIKGNGNLVTSEKQVSAFEKINISGIPTVRFYASREYRVVVTVDENLNEYLEIDAKGNTLKIGTKNGSYSFTKFQVDVYCPILIGVSVSGSGNFVGMDKLTPSTFEAVISGSGKIEGNIESERFSARIAGSGRITVVGNSKDADVGISGSGRFVGGAFVVHNATLRTSGSGSIDAYVTDNLKANISGSGGINYRGEPKLESSVSGSGKIRKM